MLQIGPYTLNSRVVLAPMAGVTDLPFRRLCKRLGAGLVVSEMLTSDTSLWNSRKSQYRLCQQMNTQAKDLPGHQDTKEHNHHSKELEPRSVQIAGSNPDMMAEAARLSVEHGAQIIDINMGCPAKKVCKKAAGSALLKDEQLVADILQAVVNAVAVPVTLKIRTGWSPDHRNGTTIARIAEDNGIQALAVHGRTRACAFKGHVEYDTIANIKASVSIPIIANGDIDSPQKAQQVIDFTGADAVMIGRAAQGKPWICREIDHYLQYGEILTPPTRTQIGAILLEHLDALHTFYGEFMGIKIARKHVGWYLKNEPNENNEYFRKAFNQIDDALIQHQMIQNYFETTQTKHQTSIYQEVIAA